MKNLTLWAAGALVLVANGLALVHVARNRAGVSQEIVLSERELPMQARLDDSSVRLTLMWRMDDQVTRSGWRNSEWFTKERLAALGFDSRLPQKSEDQWRFCARQGGREVYAAFEIDGEAWRKYLETVRQRRPEDLKQMETQSRLLFVDADTDLARLRARHPDRARVLILPAVVRMWPYGTAPGGVSGSLTNVPTVINVPLPEAAKLRGTYGKKYKVTLRYGLLDEPWVAGIEVLN